MPELKTSLLTYRDDLVDADRARLLPVYLYPLHMVNVKPWQWRECLDLQLSNHSYPYYVQGTRLYVALNNESDRLPIIKAADGTELGPERLVYAAVHNPIWLKLILRRVGHQAGKTQGYRALGKPLLMLDEWAGPNPGVDAIDIEGYVRQRRDKCTTEVQLSVSNVTLRKLKEDDNRRGKLWCRSQDGWFSRWFSSQGSQPQSPLPVLYREAKKAKNTRKQRPFLDLTAPQQFNASRSYVTQQFVEAYIESAQGYGFPLQAEVLNITQYAHRHRGNNKKRLVSLPLANFAVTLIDARENIDIPFRDIHAFLQPLLAQQGIDVTLLLPAKTSKNLQDICFLPQQRYLVVLDQGKGLPHDPYLITQQKMHAVPSCAVQHLIINPHEINDNGQLEQWLTRDAEDDIIAVQDAYYDYQLDDLIQCAASVAIKLAVCIKELHFKQLMRDTQAHISDYLPQHAAHLSDISLIAEGCLFTVQDDRPLVVPLTLTDPSQLARCNAILARHHLDCAQLLQRLITHWPYGFGPQAAITDDVDKFIKSQVILLQGNTHIFLQSPQQYTPILTPEGLTYLIPLLNGRTQSYPLSSWRLPSEYRDQPSPLTLRELLVTGSSTTDNALNKLLLHLPQLCRDWQQIIAQHKGQSMISFDPLRKAFNDQAKHCVGGDKQILGLWWQWLSATLDRPVYEPRVWLRTVPGLSGLWLDEEQGVYLVGELSGLKLILTRQPSIYRWHTLRGQLNADTLMPLLDVDFVRMGSLAGRVYPHLFIRLFNELNK